ncbi:hypothetical protein OCGS_0097 [Oceaniovalibus guishaninsula JLT2003]|uniref:Translation initiation factor 2 n=1 Tax=Oceaniovalibus guishaninsula JLT2003 TaxID=1231392 RepID=K2GTI1_9RHOB|nr:hypothetical protein [Oceaniovalibus guishaninsula]EKE45871.1 hypothetical protein OCGS_0097 [Oceaniovalibus guishaninsula JLT2003]
MTQTFFLDLSHEGVRLDLDQDGKTTEIGAVPLDDAHFDTRVEDLRREAEGLAGGPLTTRIVLPQSEILYTAFDAEGADDDARDKAVRAGLEGLTPYTLDDLVFRWQAKEGARVAVAAVARETLAEAEAFAVSHGFAPTAFTAREGGEGFDGRPDFGPTAHATDAATAPPPEPAAPVTRIIDLPDDPPEAAPELDAAKPDGEPPNAEVVGPPPPPVEPADSVKPVGPVGPTKTASPPAAPPKADAKPAEPAPAFASRRAPNPQPPAPRASDTRLSEIASRIALLPDGGAGPLPAGAPKPDTAQSPARPAQPLAAKPPAAKPPAAPAKSPEPPAAVTAAARGIAAATGAIAGAAIAGANASLAADRPAAPRSPAPGPKGPARPPGPKGPDALCRQARTRTRRVACRVRPRCRRGPRPRRGPPSPAPVRSGCNDGFRRTAQPAAPARFAADAGRRRRADRAGAGPWDLGGLQPAGPSTHRQHRADRPRTGGSGDRALRSGRCRRPDRRAATRARRGDAPQGGPAAPAGTFRPPAALAAPESGRLGDLQVAALDPAIDLPDAQRPQSVPADSRPAVPPLPAPAAAPTDAPRQGVTVTEGRPSPLPPAIPDRGAPAPVAAPIETAAIPDIRPLPRPGDPAPADAEVETDAAIAAEAQPPDDTLPDAVASEGGALLTASAPRARPADLAATVGVPGAPDDEELADAEDPALARRAQDAAAAAAEASAMILGELARVPQAQQTFAVANAPAPRDRPQPPAPQRAAPEPARVAAATVAPRVPSSASVSKAATTPNAIKLRQLNLIGVYGSKANRRALVRLPSGRFEKVKVGDRIDGGRVAAISDGQLQYVKSGRSIVLSMPSG